MYVFVIRNMKKFLNLLSVATLATVLTSTMPSLWAMDNSMISNEENIVTEENDPLNASMEQININDEEFQKTTNENLNLLKDIFDSNILDFEKNCNKYNFFSKYIKNGSYINDRFYSGNFRKEIDNFFNITSQTLSKKLKNYINTSIKDENKKEGEVLSNNENEEEEREPDLKFKDESDKDEQSQSKKMKKFSSIVKRGKFNENVRNYLNFLFDFGNYKKKYETNTANSVETKKINEIFENVVLVKEQFVKYINSNFENSINNVVEKFNTIKSSLDDKKGINEQDVGKQINDTLSIIKEFKQQKSNFRDVICNFITSKATNFTDKELRRCVNYMKYNVIDNKGKLVKLLSQKENLKDLDISTVKSNVQNIKESNESNESNESSIKSQTVKKIDTSNVNYKVANALIELFTLKYFDIFDMQFYKADMLLSEISEDLQSYSKKLNNDVKKSNIKIKKNISSINYVNNSNYANNNIINSYKTIEPSSKIITAKPKSDENDSLSQSDLLLQIMKSMSSINERLDKQDKENNKIKNALLKNKKYKKTDKEEDEKEDEKNEEEEEEGVESEKSGESGSGEDKESDNNNN